MRSNRADQFEEMAKELSLRIATGHASGLHSAVWRFFTQGAEVYATHRTMGRVEKISFHSSRICRRAFVAEHILPDSMDDRVMDRWHRAETPPAGEGKAVRALTIIFPEAHLSRELPGSQKQTIWLPPPPPASAVFLQLIFTKDDRDEIAALITPSGQLVVGYHVLTNGERIALITWSGAFEQPGVVIPASDGARRDLVCPSIREPGQKRDVSLSMFTQPDEMRCFELTGFWVPAGEGCLRFPQAGTLSRNRVYDRSM